jgi:hypothetical protein
MISCHSLKKLSLTAGKTEKTQRVSTRKEIKTENSELFIEHPQKQAQFTLFHSL